MPWRDFCVMQIFAIKWKGVSKLLSSDKLFLVVNWKQEYAQEAMFLLPHPIKRNGFKLSFKFPELATFLSPNPVGLVVQHNFIDYLGHWTTLAD